jgi:methyl-accepting chemotaxis protein
MRGFKNLKIAVKLIIGFIIVAIIAGVVGTVGIVNINKMNKLDTDMYERHTATMDDLAVVIDAYQRTRGTLKDMVINKDANKQAELKDSVAVLNQIGLNSLDEFEKGIKDDEVRKEFDIMKSALLDEFVPYTENVMNLIDTGKETEAVTYIYGDGTRIANLVQDSLNKLLELKVSLAKQSTDANSKAASDATIIMIAVIIVAVMIAILLGLYLSQMISKPVVKMVEAADKLALGDVNVAVETDLKDEIGKLAMSFGKMIENIRTQAQLAERIAAGDMTVTVDVRSESDLLNKKLAEMVENNNEVLTNIASASQQVAVGSKQVSDSSIILSQGATEQASSIEELTASLEEISSQTKLNAENANQANSLAENAKNNAIQGNTQMKEMLKSMEEINESSANISKIIKVIDDIAFQTNILALNAAVEAARAGQHGKGFAVVAEEVRNLAARSANAAKETTDMIEGSIKKTENGTKIAKETANALGEIVGGIQKVAELVNDIAVASNEQASGIGQINQGIMQVSEVVQNNSATSEESAAASEELSSQAELMKEMVSKFKLKQNVKTYSKFNELNPEILKMLENMAEKKDIQSHPVSALAKPEVKKIVLSDKEFGKY